MVCLCTPFQQINNLKISICFGILTPDAGSSPPGSVYISVYFEAGSLSTFFFTLAWEMQETYQNILFSQPWAPQPISQLPDSWKHLNISALNARTHVHNGKWEQQKRCMLTDIAMKHLFEVFKHLWFPCHRKANNTSYTWGGKQWYLSRDAGLTRPLHQKKAKNLLFNRRASWNALLSGTSCPCSLTWSWLSSPSNESRRSTFLDVQVLWLWFYTFLACL